jgi:hypothetical protein
MCTPLIGQTHDGPFLHFLMTFKNYKTSSLEHSDISRVMNTHCDDVLISYRSRGILPWVVDSVLLLPSIA